MDSICKQSWRGTNKKRSLFRKAPELFFCYAISPFSGKCISISWVRWLWGFKIWKPRPRRRLLLAFFLVRNGQFMSAFSSSASQNSSTVSWFHSCSEAVLVLSFSLRRLECSFHCIINFLWSVPKRTAKIGSFFRYANVNKKMFKYFLWHQR